MARSIKQYRDELERLNERRARKIYSLMPPGLGPDEQWSELQRLYAHPQVQKLDAEIRQLNEEYIAQLDGEQARAREREE